MTSQIDVGSPPDKVWDARLWSHVRDVRHVAPFVRAIVIKDGDVTWIPMVWSDREGRGHVSHWIDTLPRKRKIVFPNMTSPKLLAILYRRRFDYVKELLWIDEHQEWCDGMVRGFSWRPLT
jgi:hypothetical protein